MAIFIKINEREMVYRRPYTTMWKKISLDELVAVCLKHVPTAIILKEDLAMAALDLEAAANGFLGEYVEAADLERILPRPAQEPGEPQEKR